MTVGELRKALEGLPDSYDVVVNAEDDDGNSVCNTPYSAQLDNDCEGDTFFRIMVDAEEVTQAGRK